MFDIHNQRKLYDSIGREGQGLIDIWTGGLERQEDLVKQLGIF